MQNKKENDLVKRQLGHLKDLKRSLKTRHWLGLFCSLLILGLLVYFILLKPTMTGFAINSHSKESKNMDNFKSQETIQNQTDNLSNTYPAWPDTTNITFSESKGHSNEGRSENRGSRGGNGGGRGGNNNENPLDNPVDHTNPSNNTDNNSSTNNNQSNDLNPNKSKRNLKNVNSKLSLRRNGILISESDLFEGKNRFALDKNSKKISEFDINFTNDVDLSDVIADTDDSKGITFMHSSQGILKNITLFVLILPGQDGVLVCSNASSYSQVHLGCGKEEYITSEYYLTLDDPHLTISPDGLYFQVTGITGTGVTGANITAISTVTSQSTNASNVSAMAGNITEIYLTAYSTTQTWQGYFGNVTGTIQLADNLDNVIYNWSAVDPKGEIYASTNQTIIWNNIQCFNYTSTGSYADESGNGGTTNKYGMNLTQIEEKYGISPRDMDGVNETFSLIGAGTHDQFYSTNQLFNEGECKNMRMFSDTGQENDEFEEVLLYEPISTSIIFASILESDIFGFDQRAHDFQMLVLEDGHGSDTSSTIYYFFSELT